MNDKLAFPQNLTRADFHFDIPLSQIAQNPPDQRQDARLLVWQNQKITHKLVSNLSELIPEGSLFIVNNSKVIASRLHGRLLSGGKVEIFLLEPVGQEGTTEQWLALGRPMKKLKSGTPIDFGHNLTGEVKEQARASASGPSPLTISLSMGGGELMSWLEQYGDIPLPPYIERNNGSEELRQKDRVRYQTVYAEQLGSVAAPTAGLHFTPQIIRELKDKGCAFASVTLHVGAGTFLPVKTARPEDHVMHEERFMVPTSTLQAINNAMAENRPIIVVGTTAFRALEGLADLEKNMAVEKSALTDKWHRTDIFIFPEHENSCYQSWCANALITNFHQPESTLVMLVSALVGFSNVKFIYREAITTGYRFFSYGDSSLLWLKARDK